MTRSQLCTRAASSDARAVRSGVGAVVAQHSASAASVDKLEWSRKASEVTEASTISRSVPRPNRSAPARSAILKDCRLTAWLARDHQMDRARHDDRQPAWWRTSDAHL